MTSLVALLTACSLNVSSDLLHPLIKIESNFNPYAIGLVGGSLDHQPTNLNDFLDTISILDSSNKNYSVGLAQINIKNLNRYQIPVLDAIEPCNNIKIASVILKDCYLKYKNIGHTLSCYYSGNDKTGYKKDFNNSYVERFLLSYEKKHDNVYIDFDYKSFNNLKNDVTVYQPHKTSIDIVSKLTNLTKTSNKKITYFSKSFNIQQ